MSNESNVAKLRRPAMPASPDELAGLFKQRPRMLTDEVRTLIVRVYGEKPNDRHPHSLDDLLGAIENADAVEGSVRLNESEAVHMLRDYARAHASEFPAAATANLYRLTGAFRKVREEAGLDARSRLAKALADQT